jgi:hypothetical protein
MIVIAFLYMLFAVAGGSRHALLLEAHGPAWSSPPWPRSAFASRCGSSWPLWRATWSSTSFIPASSPSGRAELLAGVLLRLRRDGGRVSGRLLQMGSPLAAELSGCSPVISEPGSPSRGPRERSRRRVRRGGVVPDAGVGGSSCCSEWNPSSSPRTSRAPINRNSSSVFDMVSSCRPVVLGRRRGVALWPSPNAVANRWRAAALIAAAVFFALVLDALVPPRRASVAGSRARRRWVSGTVDSLPLALTVETALVAVGLLAFLRGSGTARASRSIALIVLCALPRSSRSPA